MYPPEPLSRCGLVSRYRADELEPSLFAQLIQVLIVDPLITIRVPRAPHRCRDPSIPLMVRDIGCREICGKEEERVERVVVLGIFIQTLTMRHLSIAVGA